MECRAGTIYLSAFSGRMAGLYRFFSFSGVGVTFLSFFFLLLCHFFWRLDVCGKILCSINRVSFVDSWFFRDFVFYKLLIFLNLLQVV